MTTPVTAQGPAIQGMSTQQQGYAPGFPPPLGIEQYLGQPQQQYLGQPQQQYLGQPQQYGGSPQQFPMQAQFPGQQQVPWQHQVPAQQLVQSLVSQLLPIAQQVILPQVVAIATQQIPQYLQQIVAQQLGWQQQQFGQAGQTPFGRPHQGSF